MLGKYNFRCLFLISGKHYTLKREIIFTKDGSTTVSIPEWKVTYRSIHGAVLESNHVFIKNGLHYALKKFREEEINLFEMGFGTGLNAWLTVQEADIHQRKICYTTIEQQPLPLAEVQQLNYAGANKRLFDQLHQAPWEQPEPITPFFTLQKLQGDLKEWGTTQKFHLIYYDAFAPAAQPELWTVGIFDKIYPLLQPGGILVTYCAKGDVHRAMKAAGFRITKLAGPPGKREMLRAEKAL